MATTAQLRLMHLAARMYYEENRTQDEIAKALDVSRPKVSRLLQQARDEGLVQIKVLDPFASADELARVLMETFGLSDAVVVAGEWGDQAQIRRRIGQAAARYLVTRLEYGDTVGIGWGRTMYAVAHALDVSAHLNLTVTPLVGGLSQVPPSFQVEQLAHQFCEHLGGSWQGFYVPALVEDPDTHAALLASRDVTRITQSWDHLDVAVVGIGNVDLGSEIRVLFADYLDAGTMENLQRLQAVGDICMRFFDITGNPVDGLPGAISIELHRLKQARRRIGVAGGAEKAEAILGAVRGGFVNVLITDESAVRNMLTLVQ